VGAAARAAIVRATRALRRYGFISLWSMLTLSVVSAVILLFRWDPGGLGARRRLGEEV